jgi:glycosyltransferase involved in cell wall biosynthesis
VRVLHLIETLGVGGAERALVNTLPWLARCDIESEVATLWGDDELAPELEQQGVCVHSLGLQGRWNLWRGAHAVKSLVARRGIDVVHSHLYFAGIYTGLAARLARFPAVITLHNLAYAEGCNQPGLALQCRKVLNRAVVQTGFAKIVAVSDAVASHYADHLGLSSISLVPNGVDTDSLVPRRGHDVRGVRDLYSLPHDIPILLMAGRMVAEKGHMWMLDVVAELSLRAVKFKLLIVGDGPLQEQVAARIHSLGLESCVELRRTLSHSRLLELMQAVDILVAPSVHEGFGLTVAEAMCLELPVVASRVGGLVELVGTESGLLIEPGDIAGFADTLQQMLSKPQLAANNGQRGRARIEQFYSLRTVAESLSGLYHELGG